MKTVIEKTAALLFAAAISAAAMAGFEEGLAAYDNKDYAMALQVLSPLADHAALIGFNLSTKDSACRIERRHWGPLIRRH